MDYGTGEFSEFGTLILKFLLGSGLLAAVSLE